MNPEQASAILDFNQPLDVALFDAVVKQFFDGNMALQQVLVDFQNDDGSWVRVADIMEQSQDDRAKQLALRVLDNTVKFKWSVLPDEQREGIKAFCVSACIKMSETPELLMANESLLADLNLVLVAVVKQEWPKSWPNFIPDLVAASNASESLCANNMNILLLLSEEVFDYSADQMTSSKTHELKSSLNEDFKLIYELVEMVLKTTKDPVLLGKTLETLLAFLHWIPVGFIFETPLLQTLFTKFFGTDMFQNKTLQCLAEIASIKVKEHSNYNAVMAEFFVAVMIQVTEMITVDTDIAQAYQSGNWKTQEFIVYLNQFICNFLTSHLYVLENSNDQTRQMLYQSLLILLRIAQAPDREVFKTGLEFWNVLVDGLVATLQASRHANKTSSHTKVFSFSQNKPADKSGRLVLYADVLSKLRHVMIENMAKPEDVLIMEDEHGQIVKEEMKNTDVIALYKNMQRCLMNLTYLDPDENTDIMKYKLQQQVELAPNQLNVTSLNTLCWAIGAISGSLTELQERQFLVDIIEKLLFLCDKLRSKEHKAVIASNIMFVVGQYPRFLRRHWRFLRTVVKKLFEFMEETYPGVQDMSCDTLLKIAKTCKHQFVVQQDGDPPFVYSMLETMPHTISFLETQQVYAMYEAVAMLIDAETDPNEQQKLLMELMKLPNAKWSTLMTAAKQNVDSLWDDQTVESMIMVLATNIRVAGAIKAGYVVQLSRLYQEVLTAYNYYSNYISNAVMEQGEVASRIHKIKRMLLLKKNVLVLIQTYVRHCGQADEQSVYETFLPALMDSVLSDYKAGIPNARDAEVLHLYSVIIDKLGPRMNEHVGVIFDHIFPPTLEMITRDFKDFPDHRKNFFKLIESLISKNFYALCGMGPGKLQDIIDSIVWAFQHLERDVMDLGLSSLLKLLEHVVKSEFANDFYAQFFTSLLADLLHVLVDRFHRPGLSLQIQLLRRMFNIVESGAVGVPLWDDQTQHGMFSNNRDFVHAAAFAKLKEVLPNVSPDVLNTFLQGMFALNTQVSNFKQHVKDFLVESKQYSNVEFDEALELGDSKQQENTMGQQHQQQQPMVANISTHNDGNF